MTVGWWSQPYPPEGTMGSEGIAKQLGTPELDPMVVLLRESAQNSWDARAVDTGSISLEYRFETLVGDRAGAFRSMLLPGPFPAFDDLAALPDPVVLAISDRGTTGLGGPLRSDEPPPPGESPDFVNLVRNVGEARDREHGGGTYGFGKGSLFRVSHGATILVDTRCHFRGTFQRRLMGAALGPSYEQHGKRFTGRHWWGRVAEDGVVDPLVDADADRAATMLGLGGFAPGDTGTDIYVLFLDPGQDEAGDDRSAAAAGEVIAGAAAWYLWPMLVERQERRRIDLAINVDGAPVRVPDPARSRRIRPFVRALARLDSGEAITQRRKSRPFHVGDIAFRDDLVGPSDDTIVDRSAPFEGPAHHCARMRCVELVVDYLEGPTPSDPDVQYGAVFRASEEADDYFASAEPPTHDAWVHQHLSGAAKGTVVGAQSFVRKQMTAHVGSDAPPRSSSAVPLGRLSSALARTLPAASGDGGAIGDSGATGGSGGARSPFVTGSPQLVVQDGEPRIVQQVVVRDRHATISLVAQAHVVVDGGAERTAPIGGAVPEVLGWQSDSGLTVAGEFLTVGPDDDRNWNVVVRPAPLTTTMLRIRQAAEPAP